MITLLAPHPGYTTVLVLPDPLLGDIERLESNVVVNRTLTNNPYSYIVTQPNHRVFQWSLALTRKKALEFQDFVNAHSHDLWRVDWDNSSYVCQLRVNPFELNMVARSVIAGSEERVALEIELEKVQ